MSRRLSEDTNATLLLCAALEKESPVMPLSLREYNQVARWLKGKQLRPANLLKEECWKKAAASNTVGLEEERIRRLMKRGIQLGFCVEAWQRSGVWIMSRGDKTYPEQLKTGLKGDAPALLFGVGPRDLFDTHGFAIMGPDRLTRAGQEMARQIAGHEAANDKTIISVGHYQVAAVAQEAVGEIKGKSVRVLADKLILASVKKSARNAIAEQRLVLVSTRSPDDAMSRKNAEEAGLLSVGLAQEAVYVAGAGRATDTYGAFRAMEHCFKTRTLFAWEGRIKSGEAQKLLNLGAGIWEDRIELVYYPSEQNVKQLPPSNLAPVETTTEPPLSDQETEESSVCDAVRQILVDCCKEPRTRDELHKSLKVQKRQLDRWLKLAVEGGTLNKSKAAGPKKPVYVITPATIAENASDTSRAEPEPDERTLFEVVQPILVDCCKEPRSRDELHKSLNVQKGQLDRWLKLAVEGGSLKKDEGAGPKKPVYVITPAAKVLNGEKVGRQKNLFKS